MRFSEAMKIVEDGGMVRREQWQQDWVIRLGKSLPTIILIEDMAFHHTMNNLSTSDMGAKDWVEVKNYCSCSEPKSRWKESSGWYCTMCYKPIKGAMK